MAGIIGIFQYWPFSKSYMLLVPASYSMYLLIRSNLPKLPLSIMHSIMGGADILHTEINNID